MNPLAKPKRKKIPIEEIHAPNFEEIHARILRAPPNPRAYLCLLWLTGNRVSEILGIRTRVVTGVYEYSRPTKNNPDRKVYVGKYRRANEEERVQAGLREWEVEPVKKWDIEIQKPIIRINARTLKRHGRPYHKYIARIDCAEEEAMWNIVEEHISSKQPHEPLFTFGRQHAWAMCDKYLGIPPHKLRGIRATRDAVRFHLSSTGLQKKFNWANAAMPLHYAKKDTRELEQEYMRE